MLIESWNDKDFLLTQQFVCGEQVVAKGSVQGSPRRRSLDGEVPTAEIFKLLGTPYSGAKRSQLPGAQLAIASELAVKSLLTPQS